MSNQNPLAQSPDMKVPPPGGLVGPLSGGFTAPHHALSTQFIQQSRQALLTFLASKRRPLMANIQIVPDALPRPHSSGRLIVLVMALFFAFGFCTVLVDTLIPKLKSLFSLTYAEAMLTQFCFFGAYFIVSLPAAKLVQRLGYLQSVTLGLMVMAVGCLSFMLAAELGVYPAFLAALFTLACGVTIVQVAANPLATSIGDPRTAHSRLTLAQAFNSLATTVGPIFGAAFILGEPWTKHAVGQAGDATLQHAHSQSIQQPFLLICFALCLLALVCWLCRSWVVPCQGNSRKLQAEARAPVWKNSRLRLGTLSIFLYVGAEVSVGSLLANYLMQPSVLALDVQTAGGLVSVYWGAAMVGRFIGSRILRERSPGAVLMVCACGAVALACASALSSGLVAAVTIIGIGLFNAIMFPTIFALAVEDMQDRAAEASGMLCLAIVGGAVVPLLTGMIADAQGLACALLAPAACYVGIAVFGWRTRQPKARTLRERDAH